MPKEFPKKLQKELSPKLPHFRKKVFKKLQVATKKNTEGIPSLIYGISEENHENKSQEIAENISQFSNYFQSNLFKIPVTELP